MSKMLAGNNLAIGNATIQPFLNVIKMTDTWWANNGTTTFNQYGGEIFNDVTDGYPTTFVGTGTKGTFNWILFKVFDGLTPDPISGKRTRNGLYAFRYDGGDQAGGTAPNLSFSQDASGVSKTGPGRYTMTVNSTSVGVWVQITNSLGGLGSPVINNFRMYYVSGSGVNPEYNGEDLAENQHEIFNPDFLARDGAITSSGAAHRFMDWMSTNRNSQVAWANRPTTTQPFWNYGSGTAEIYRVGVPVEIMVALCNKLNRNGWFCLPGNASDDYATQFATIIGSGNGSAPAGMTAPLNSNLMVYLEHANEVWNGLDIHVPGMITSGYAAFPGNKSIQWTGTAQISTLTLTRNTTTTGSIINGNQIFDAGGTLIAKIADAGGADPTWPLDFSTGDQPAGTPMTEGNHLQAVYDWHSLRTVQNAATFKGILGNDRVKVIMGGAIGGLGHGAVSGDMNNSILSLTDTTRGGPGTYFTGTAASHCDALATAPYWPADSHSTPQLVDVDDLFNNYIFDKVSTVTFVGHIDDGITTGTTGNVLTVTNFNNVQIGPGMTLHTEATGTITNQTSGTPANNGVYTVDTAQSVPPLTSIHVGWNTMRLALGWAWHDLLQAKSFNVDYVCYEGGWQFGNTTGVNNTTIYEQAQSDKRLYTAYSLFLNTMNNNMSLRTNPLGMFMLFADIGGPVGGFNFGQLENVLETTSQRYQAILDYIGAGGLPIDSLKSIQNHYGVFKTRPHKIPHA